MPYLKIQTNASLSPEQRNALLGKSSKLAARVLGKSEDYVMVAIEDEVPMCFGGSNAPSAYLELHSIGLTPDKAKACVAELSPLMAASFGVDAHRVYVNCLNAERTMWGWNGDTFG